MIDLLFLRHQRIHFFIPTFKFYSKNRVHIFVKLKFCFKKIWHTKNICPLTFVFSKKYLRNRRSIFLALVSSDERPRTCRVILFNCKNWMCCFINIYYWQTLFWVLLNFYTYMQIQWCDIVFNLYFIFVGDIIIYM